ncbi:MAG: hypothetical protein KDD81_13665 [Rhodobacteraceae bacterium]|nr:hypothetical protein [Paracoccaceae bacterium]MCB2120433.1 hypothetical protein [Paracoccaceae bacterium]MCB2123523.1 hypothetical protein [Paracoccaceae bacterium]MCB2131724.1 hypothetical protein [Paracoccaceae bacterium]MCB2159720.1 hypothetical protein [Paracoccaceae bacterium]
MLYRIPHSLHNVEGLLRQRGVDISHETVRFWRLWQVLFARVASQSLLT